MSEGYSTPPSPEEVTDANFLMINHFLQSGQSWCVRWSPEGSNPEHLSGAILAAGTDDTGPWIEVRITEHTKTVVQYDEVVPGFEDYLNAMYSEPSDALLGMEEMLAIHGSYPETDLHENVVDGLIGQDSKQYLVGLEGLVVYPDQSENY